VNYKTNDKYWKDTTLFRCQCGEYSFLELNIFEEDTEEYRYSLCFIEQPCGFTQRLKWLFKPDKHVREIILTKEDIKELARCIQWKIQP